MSPGAAQAPALPPAFSPSPPPSAPDSPVLCADDEGAASVGHDESDSETAPTEAPFARIGLSLKSARSLSFGAVQESAGTKHELVVKKETNVERKQREGKLDKALRQIEELQQAVRALKPRGRVAPAAECTKCPALVRDVQLKINQIQHYKKKLGEATRDIELLTLEHTEQLAAVSTEHERKLAAQHRRLDAKAQDHWRRLEAALDCLKKVNRESDDMKQKLRASQRELLLQTNAAAKHAKQVEQLEAALAEKTAMCQNYETQLSEIERELQSDSDADAEAGDDGEVCF